jgi:DNA-binding MarR family transcriptional regulator
VFARLTAAGRALLAGLEGPATAVRAEALAGLSPENMGRLAELLREARAGLPDPCANADG